jgi:heme-degrading monooxygenase HmoA
VAAIAALAAAGWWVGIHAPEQRRIELARIEAQRVEQARLESERARAEAENRARAQQEAQRHAARQAFPQPGQPHENTLGMKFVPVPGTVVLFSIWETREQDYGAFARATGRAWSNANAGPTHPAVNVSWEDAQAFCQWLTDKERRENKIGPGQSYRLPTDAEWSIAVGLTNEPGGSPADKNLKVKNHYPWGTQWPPPRGAGNYGASLNVDTFERTAPVGSFTANPYGLYDLGGNVWEWVEDAYQPGESWRVLRGASFNSGGGDFLLSSGRIGDSPVFRYDYYGFRVVVAVGSSSR